MPGVMDMSFVRMVPESERTETGGGETVGGVVVDGGRGRPWPVLEV